MSGKIIAGIAGAVITVGAAIVCAVECHLRKKQKALPEQESEEEIDVDGYIDDISYRLYELRTDMGLIEEVDPLEIDDDDISLE